MQLININMANAAASFGAKRYFFSSIGLHLPGYGARRARAHGGASVTRRIRTMKYGWEEALCRESSHGVWSEEIRMAVRIARFQNCYGPEGTWTGGREKAPAAICRKVAEVEDGGSIEVWGDGTAIRSLYLCC